MNNGQMNIASIPAAMPFTARDAPTVDIATIEGALQSGSDFAGLLSGAKLVAQKKTPAEQDQAEQPQTEGSKNFDFFNVTVQLTLAGYIQPGISTADNKQIALPDDMQQNATMTIEQSAKITDPAVTSGEPLPVDRLQNVAKATEPVNVRKQQQPEAARTVVGDVLPTKTEPVAVAPATVVSAPLPVDRLQNVAKATEPVNVRKQQQPEAARTVVGDVLPTKTEPVAAAPATVVSAPLPADRLQNVTKATEPVNVQKQQQPEAARTVVGDVLPTKTEPVAAAPTAVVSAVAQSLATSFALPLGVDLEIQHPEPQLMAVTAAVAPVSTDKTIHEALSITQRHSTDPQSDKGVDLISVREASMPGMEASDGSSTVGSESSSSGGESDGDYDNPDTTQNMPGQLVVEQQKVSAVMTRPAQGEPLRQDIAEKVMPQVKEQFERHEIKPGKQQITLTLSPDTLGEIKMNLNLQGEKLSIEIVTESRSVRDAIVQHADALKESLARQNITMESFDVTTGGKGSGNQGQNQNAWRELAKQQQQYQQQQQFWTSPRGYNTAQADRPPGPAVQQGRQGQSMLDIHY
ncbi:MAG: flagellar hook-length control protein FliK [Desulfuromonadaceae bacterium]